MQPKFDVATGTKPDIHSKSGRFILSLSEMMTLPDKPEDLCVRYLPSYMNKRTGEIEILSPTACSKIAAQVAWKMLGKKVVITGDHDVSFNKDDFMANMIEQANLARCYGTKACPKTCPHVKK